MEKIAIYPGSFDPVTFGHIDLIERATKAFDLLVVAVANNPRKAPPLFTPQERAEMLKEVTKGIKGVEIDIFSGLLVDYAQKRGAKVIVKGLRALSDFEFEFQMALMNRRLQQDIETFFLMTHEKYAFLSSSLVKEVVELGGDATQFVPKIALKKMKEKIKKK